MGRAFKQRKLKKTRRVKVRSTTVTSKSSKEKDKKRIKPWEYVLAVVTGIVAIGAIIFFAKTGNITPDIDPTPTAVQTATTE